MDAESSSPRAPKAGCLADVIGGSSAGSEANTGVRFASLALPPKELLKENSQPGCWGNRLLTGPIEASDGVSLGLPGSGLASNPLIVDSSESSAKAPEIDFLGAWGLSMARESSEPTSSRRSDHFSAPEQDSDDELLHGRKKMKYQAIPSPTNVDASLDGSPLHDGQPSTPLAYVDGRRNLWRENTHEENGHMFATQSEPDNLVLHEAEVNFQETDPALWAWIFSMKLGISESLYQELISEHEPILSKFITSLASNLAPFRDQETGFWMNTLTRRESVNSFKEFAHLLWCVNSKFIRNFRPSKQTYLQEQAAIQDWIIHVFTESKKSSAVLAGQGHRKPPNSGPTQSALLRLIYMAIEARYSYPHYELFSHNVLQATGAVCRKQIWMAQAVVNVMAAYYEMGNPMKWRLLFPTDRLFVHGLTKLQNWNSEDCALYHDFKVLEAHPLFPWKKTVDAQSICDFCRGDIPVISLHGQIKTKPGLRARLMQMSLQPSGSADSRDLVFKMSTSNEKNKLLLEQDPQKMWAFISRFISDYDKFIAAKLVRLRSDPIVQVLHIWKVQQIASPSAQIKPLIHILRKDSFLIELKKLLDLLWNINARLLEVLGQEPYGEMFLIEQDKLQKEFYSLLTCSHKKLDNFYYRTPEGKDTREIQEMILKAMDSGGDPTVLYNSKRRKGGITRRNIVMTQAVVNVMICYYWNNNPSKWLKVFLDEDNFILNLAQIETRLTKRMYYLEFMNGKFQDLRDLNLIPWENHFILKHDQTLLIRKSFQTHSHTKSVMKIK
ncbi:hypothetical protein PGT21_020238 [Puccinia graminis f. sp. tritici]|uniref:Uncharacterized protein n=1 Tax=Puccinia graminis f. sp. tritici TaxID=56615 RepID=A0A5B0RI99_PUCGR|nr:hypothetical protein PGT21_020238 [Puccinia graminis f. sp. tritici]KAA1125576.1 hypothetical protein PGTUg99_020986 [Puccinia graminis f. sp. tritici]